MPYTYNAKLARVIDGDTVVLDVDLGFSIYSRHAVRLAGVNAPEMSTPEGRLAEAWTHDWFDENHATENILLTTVKGREFEKYGRYLGLIRSLVTGALLNDDILAAGHAVAIKY